MRYFTSGLKLKIPKFAPESRLRNRGSDLNVGISVREFALSDVRVSAEITINTIIHMIYKHVTLSGFMAIYCAHGTYVIASTDRSI